MDLFQSSISPFKRFISDFKTHISQNRTEIEKTLSNIFTMRLVGNKTHGDLAEIAIAEYINTRLENYSSKHVGKDLYRAKTKEKDVEVTNLISNLSIPISLKAYGDGPLQLSTDKNFEMFPLLQNMCPNGTESMAL